MSNISEGSRPWYGISRILPDGSVATPQSPGIITRVPPSAEVLRQAAESLCKPVVAKGINSMTPREIHERALVEEGESMKAVTQRLLNEGVAQIVFNSGK